MHRDETRVAPGSTVPRRIERTAFNSRHGEFTLLGFDMADGSAHAVLTAGNVAAAEQPLVRIQSACLTGTALGALLCDCREQTERSLQLIGESGAGVVLYLDQEGRGHGLVEKVRQLALITTGVADTVSAAGDLPPDVRDYGAALAILGSLLQSRSIRLLTNNPKKINAVCDAGWQVERESLEVPPTDHNLTYLRTKKERMGHLLQLV